MAAERYWEFFVVVVGGGGLFFYTLGPLGQTDHCLNATAYLRIVTDCISDGCFQQDQGPCHKDQITSNWFVEHDGEVTILK